VPETDPLTSVNTHWVWEASPDGMVLVDCDGIILAASSEAHRVFGYEPNTLIGCSVEVLVTDDVDAKHKAHRADFAESPTRRPMGVGNRLIARRADGTMIPVHIALAPLDGGFTLAAVRDMTTHALVEDRLVDLTRRRLIAEDRERIARDLHDTVIQELFALGMTLQSTVATVPDPSLAERLDGAVAALDSVIHSIRSLIFDISHTNKATDGSLRTKVVEVAAGFTPSLGFEPTVIFRGPIDTAVPLSHRDHIVAVVREGLANVARHADASSGAVSVVVSDTDVTVRVQDDGRGMPPDHTRRSGLDNLATRAVDASGRFDIEGDPSGGTTLRWTAPINNRSIDEETQR
jgi:PAS domain S-box-containing protein